MTESTQPKRRVGLAIWLIVSQLLAVGSLFFWLIAAFFGLLAYGANDLSETPTVVTGLWLYPIFPLVMAVAAWVAFAKRRNVLSAVLSGLSFAPVAVLILGIGIQNWIWNWTR